VSTDRDALRALSNGDLVAIILAQAARATALVERAGEFEARLKVPPKSTPQSQPPSQPGASTASPPLSTTNSSRRKTVVTAA